MRALRHPPALGEWLAGRISGTKAAVSRPPLALARTRALRWTKRCVLAAVLSAMVGSLAAEARAEDSNAVPLRTLDDLTRAAERNYPSLVAAREGVEAARARLAEATISPFFQWNATGAFNMAPTADGTPIFSRDPQLPISNPWRPVVQAGVEGAIPLYTFGKFRAGREAAKAGIQVAEENVHQAQARLRFDVRRAYFALQLALDVQQMIREGQGRLEKAVATLESRIAAGDPDVSTMDRYRLSSTLAEVEARASEAERLEVTSKEALIALTGERSFRVQDCPIEPVEVRLASLEAYVSRALADRPEARMLRAAIRARRADVDVNRGRYYPDVALAFRASQSWGPGITDQNNPFIMDPANFSTLGAGLVARWSLDLWGNAHRVRRAEASLAETRAQAEEAERGLRLEVAAIFHELSDAWRREKAWGKGHRDSRAWFIAAAQAYDIGTLEPRDLVDAVRSYFLARFNHLQAIRDANTALADLERASGQALVEPTGWEAKCEE